MFGPDKKAQQLKRIADALEQLVPLAKSFANSAATIAAAMSKPTIGPEKTIRLEVQGENMKDTAPVLIIDTATKRLFAIGLDAAGAQGASLAAGATVAGVVSDPTVAVLTPDPTPMTDPNGIPSVFSAVIAPATPPKTNVPVTITVTVTNADGTTQPPVETSVQFTAGTETSLELEVL